MGPMRKIDFSKLRIANGLNHTIIVEPFIQSIAEGNYPIFKIYMWMEWLYMLFIL